MATTDRIISAVVDTTGEVIEYHVMSPSEVTDAYRDVEAHLKAYHSIKTSLLNTSMDMISKQEKGKL